LFVSALFAETIEGCETKNNEDAAITAKDFLLALFISKL
jgi:hypothetical protein